MWGSVRTVYPNDSEDLSKKRFTIYKHLYVLALSRNFLQLKSVARLLSTWVPIHFYQRQKSIRLINHLRLHTPVPLDICYPLSFISLVNATWTQRAHDLVTLLPLLESNFGLRLPRQESSPSTLRPYEAGFWLEIYENCLRPSPPIGRIRMRIGLDLRPFFSISFHIILIGRPPFFESA